MEFKIINSKFRGYADYKLCGSLHLPALEGGGPTLAVVEGPYDFL